MTNFEKYKDEILTFIAASGFAKVGNEITHCYNTNCGNCQFNGKGDGCDIKKKEWLDEEYKEPSPYADWEIDDKVEVSDDRKYWTRTHFAGVSENGKPMTWCNGWTSWTTEVDDDKMHWEYARKVEE